MEVVASRAEPSTLGDPRLALEEMRQKGNGRDRSLDVRREGGSPRERSSASLREDCHRGQRAHSRLQKLRAKEATALGQLLVEL